MRDDTIRLAPACCFLAAAAIAATQASPPPVRPVPPYRMWAFAYNFSGGLFCNTTNGTFECDPTHHVPTAVPIARLYPPHTYNIINPGRCSSLEEVAWLGQRGITCMGWSWCFNMPTTAAMNDSTIVDHFRFAALGNGATFAQASPIVGMDECAELPGLDGAHKMALAAEGYRAAKKEQPELFLAAWNIGATSVFSPLMRDGTIDLAIFETNTVRRLEAISQ